MANHQEDNNDEEDNNGKPNPNHQEDNNDLEDNNGGSGNGIEETLQREDKKTLMFAGCIFWLMVLIVGGATAGVLLNKKGPDPKPIGPFPDTGADAQSNTLTPSPTSMDRPTPAPATPSPTLKPTLTSAAQLQLSALELIPNEEIVSHTSTQNVAMFNGTAVFGAPLNDNYRGSVFVHVKDANGEWSHQVKLVAPVGAAGYAFGYSVALFDDTIIVGAYGDDKKGASSGSAHIFVRNGVTWSHQKELFAVDSAAGDIFGHSVAIYGNTVIVGAPLDDDNGEDSGSAHIYVRNGVTWSHQKKLVAPDGAANDQFGRSVALYSNSAIVSAPYDDDDGDASGSAHIFVRNGVTWSHEQKLVAPDGAASDGFGKSVAIYGNSAIVGAPYDNGNGYDSGSAHIFVRIGVWLHQQKLVAPDGAANGKFGYSVAIYGNTVTVGAVRDDDNGDDSGSAHVFVRNEVTWSPHAKILAPKSGEEFGQSVGIYDGTIIGGSYSGEVYVFSG